jgi:CRP/FNR family transcriptional regulator, cyclic AMP receptor protein
MKAQTDPTPNDLIERFELLDGVTPQALTRHCPTAKVCAFRHRGAIYNQGTRCNHLFFVVSGLVKLARISRDGRELTTALRANGEFFGPDLGNPGVSKAQETATAKGAVSVWRVPTQEFRDLLFHHPTLGLRILETLAQRQRQMERRLECFAFKRTEARLAETLRELSRGFEPRCEHGFGTHIRLSQQELADLVGATRPVVSTILNRLRRKGVLGYSREYVCVRAIETIEQMIGD